MAAPGAEQEFTVRVPSREENKKYHVMKFNASLNVDFSKWTQARMVRENNQKIVNSTQPVDDDPKFGAGSVFGKDMKEEARRQKLGIIRKKYDPDAQPWLMRVGGKGGRKYKGIREGGVSNNTTYYVFTHGKDGAFEAFPIKDWYNFTPIMRYKTLDADEAEEKFAQRGKILNKWAVMVNKKLRPGEEGAEEDLDGEEGGKGKKGKKGDTSFKISDMDDWAGSDDGLDTDEEKDKKDDDSDSDDGKKNKRSKDTKKKKKKKNTDVDEAFEDSDDGDDEGREVDYMSDESSESDEETAKDHDVKGVDQDEGLSKMLDSESSESDDDKKKSDKDDDDDEDETGKKKKKKGGSRANSDDEDSKGKKKKSGSAASSRSATPTKEMEKADRDKKRNAMVANLLDPNATGEPNAKKTRLEQFGAAGSSGAIAGTEAITEEAVRRYLKRRPMTTTDLLKKFRSKKTGILNAQLVQLLANILKKINPHKQKVKGVTYLSLKEGQ